MNEELQTTLNDALVGVIESATSAKDFILAELPDVVNQLLMWNMTVSLAWFSLFFLATVIFICGLIRSWNKSADFEQLQFFFLGSLSSFFLTCCSHTWLKILIAPKLYLLEYAASLVK